MNVKTEQTPGKSINPAAPKDEKKFPTGGKSPLLDRIEDGTEKGLDLTPLEQALYRLTCTVNTRTTPISDAVTEVMKELGAEQGMMYLRTFEGNLEYYMRIENIEGRLEMRMYGPKASDMVRRAFEENCMLFSVPNWETGNQMSTLYKFNMVPGDVTYSFQEIKNGNVYLCAVPLFMAENGDTESSSPKKLGVLVLKGKTLKIRESKLSGAEAVQKVALFIASGARMLSRMVDARFDTTTGLPKRPEFEAQLETMLRSYLQGSRNFSLIMVDLDHFKRINDTYGHDAGDVTLRAIAQVLEKSIRVLVKSTEAERRDDLGYGNVDLAFRWGGEELMALLRNTELDAARDIAERIRNKIGSTQIGLPDGSRISLSCSIGVVDADNVVERKDSHHSSVEDLMSKMTRTADFALYEAKRNGRDKVAYATLSDAGPVFVVHSGNLFNED